jgi:bifunctional UDP-N-acetylglucosamine pyrophosphorylase/glucosamine-1-phosphate N-acetyltransferase
MVSMSVGRPLAAVVLAAGEGTRMKSSRPKPLHVLCGRPMVLHVLDAVAELPLDRAVVVVGHGAETVTKTLHEQAPPDLTIDFVEQRAQRGTGDALAVALIAFPDDDLDDGDIVVLPGDAPLVQPATLAMLVREHRLRDAAATLLTARTPEQASSPLAEFVHQYGRVVRAKDGTVSHVVEVTDATEAELEIDEVNTSIYCFRRGLLAPALRRLSPENAQGEYYLTDVVGVLHDAGYLVHAVVADDAMETVGVNDRVQLALAEAELRRRTNKRWMAFGVTMLDPERTYIDARVELANDVTLFPGTMLQGHTVIGAGARIGPNVRLADCVVGDEAVVEQSVGELSEIGAGATVGPYAVLLPGSVVSEGTRTPPFYTAAGGDDT